MDKMVGKKNSYIKWNLLVKAYWLVKYIGQHKYDTIFNRGNPLESDHLQTSPYLHSFSCPIYFIYKLVRWKLVVKIKLILFKTFYLISIEYTIIFN